MTLTKAVVTFALALATMGAFGVQTIQVGQAEHPIPGCLPCPDAR
jgi:hypothetical protein